MFNEPAETSWPLRFGTPPPDDLPLLDRFLSHRSVRHYTSDPIPESTIAGLVAAAQSASTSSNLQLWTAISVQDPDRRDKIATLCADQHQVRDAAWFFAFFADHNRIRNAAAAVGGAAKGLDYQEFSVMAMIDAALAGERMVCAAESLGIGCCYIGALRNHPQAVRELLHVPEGTVGLFGLCLGWPDPAHEAEIKPRFHSSAVWHREAYDPATSEEIADYDRRMGAFYDSQNMKGDVTWSMRSARRIDGSEKSMTGREVLKAEFEKNGFGRR